MECASAYRRPSIPPLPRPRYFSVTVVQCLSRIYAVKGSVADPGCSSRIRIFSFPVPNFSIPVPGSASKNVSILTQKIGSKLSEIGSGLLIPDPDPDFLPILERGQKGTGSRIPAPGSRIPSSRIPNPDPQPVLWNWNRNRNRRNRNFLTSGTGTGAGSVTCWKVGTGTVINYGSGTGTRYKIMYLISFI